MAEVFLVPRSEGEPFCLSPPSRPMHLEGEEVTGRVYFVELRAPFVVMCSRNRSDAWARRAFPVLEMSESRTEIVVRDGRPYRRRPH